MRPKKDSKTGEFFYTEQDLPHMITPLESKLGEIRNIFYCLLLLLLLFII